MHNFEFNAKLLTELENAAFEPQKEVGDPPASWARELDIDHGFVLPDRQLSRGEVRKLCQSREHDPLFGYLVAMAWGWQGRGIAGRKHAKAAWNAREGIRQQIALIQRGDLNRSESYDLFTDGRKNRFSGLGPAYFTKLLYFFCPTAPPDCYIMDQWTVKSIVLLTGKNFIRHSDQGPTISNVGLNYELFCLAVEALAARLQVSPDVAEERLFSVGSIRRGPRGEWRQLVVDSWKARARNRYSHRDTEALRGQLGS